MKNIKEITASETFPIRHPVLRSGKPVESCEFDGDNLETTKHFGFYIDNELTGVLSLFKNPNDNFNDNNQFQIRGMAILENHQKKGIGKSLILYAENLLKSQGQHLIWLNARENAVGFYKNLGYTVFGNQFEIKDVGIHFLMIKRSS